VLVTSVLSVEFVCVCVCEHVTLNLVVTIQECLWNSVKWSLPVEHTFYFLCLMYYLGNMFRP